MSQAGVRSMRNSPSAWPRRNRAATRASSRAQPSLTARRPRTAGSRCTRKASSPAAGSISATSRRSASARRCPRRGGRRRSAASNSCDAERLERPYERVAPGEVPVQGGAADPGGPGDLVHGGGRFAGEQGGGGAQHLVTIDGHETTIAHVRHQCLIAGMCVTQRLLASAECASVPGQLPAPLPVRARLLHQRGQPRQLVLVEVDDGRVQVARRAGRWWPRRRGPRRPTAAAARARGRRRRSRGPSPRRRSVQRVRRVRGRRAGRWPCPP